MLADTAERVALEPSAGLRVLDVAAGYEHSLLRCADGFVYSFGVGAHGRLGHGLASTATPRRVEAIEHVAQVAAGGFQSLAVTDSGHAYSWGWGESGSTGHGERHHHVVPKLITALAHLRIVQAGSVLLERDGVSRELRYCDYFGEGALLTDGFQMS